MSVNEWPYRNRTHEIDTTVESAPESANIKVDTRRKPYFQKFLQQKKGM